MEPARLEQRCVPNTAKLDALLWKLTVVSACGSSDVETRRSAVCHG